jgi:hypothetical protein
VSHDCKVHAFNISTFQLYEQLSNFLVFRKGKKEKEKKTYLSHIEILVIQINKNKLRVLNFGAFKRQ